MDTQFKEPCEVCRTEQMDRKNFDTLTSLYTYSAALERIQQILMENPQGCYHMTIMKACKSKQFVDEYGTAFALSILENWATVLRLCYRDFGRNVVLSRAGKAAFIIFIEWEDASEVEEQLSKVYRKLMDCYRGRNKNIVPKFLMGTYHLEPGMQDLSLALRRCGKSYHYARRTDTVHCVYRPEMAGEEILYQGNPEEARLEGEQFSNYDTRFISFAVSLLSSSNEVDSSMDMLLQRIGWYFDFDDVLVSEFINNNAITVTNKWSREAGVWENTGTTTTFESLAGFFAGFDENGICLVDDMEHYTLSEQEHMFFDGMNIRSFLNILMYSNDKPIAFMTCSRRNPVREVSDFHVNSMTQLSRVMAAFVALRIRNRENAQQLDNLLRDELTGLYQYSAFNREVRRALYDFDPNRVYALIYSDITNFSYLNENFGYNEGNRVLREYAKLLKNANVPEAIYCHINADRFAMFYVMDTKEQIEQKVLADDCAFTNYLRENYPMSDLRVTTGLYYIDNPKVEVFKMIDAANHVRKSIKNNHLNYIGIYSDAFKEQRQSKINIVGSVHDAIQRGMMEVFLQPKFSMKSRKVIGAEALVRWRNEDGSYKMPGGFVPILEEVGYIVDVDYCVFEQVMQTLADWKLKGRELIPVSINFSRAHIRANSNPFERIVELAKKYEVDPQYVEIEITESFMAADREQMYERLLYLRRNGFKVDIDDFGTGYSSLSMLLSAPVDIVKVDKSLIDHYSFKEEKEYINQIGSLIKSANKQVIFEGVESEEQVSFLTDYGYENAQGYVFSRPIPIQEFEEKYIYR